MLTDVNLLFTNSVRYNGESHPITATAMKIVKACEEQFDEHAEQFDVLERNLAQQSLLTSYPIDDADLFAASALPFSAMPMVDNEDQIDATSPAVPSMSLETFISGDFQVMEHEMQEIDLPDTCNELNAPGNEPMTTEDILGKIWIVSHAHLNRSLFQVISVNQIRPMMTPTERLDFGTPFFHRVFVNLAVYSRDKREEQQCCSSERCFIFKRRSNDVRCT
jgi:hypothetical protein